MKPFLTRTPDTRILRAFGEELHLHLDGSQTGNQFTLVTEITPPGGGPPPHWHDKEDEWFHVLEGPVSFFVNGEWTEARTGESVFAPRGQIHTFKNNTTSPTRMLIHVSPSGFEKFFGEAAEEFQRPEGPDMQRVLAIATAHGIHFA